MSQKRIKKHKTTARAKLIRELDKLWSQAIRLEWNGTCAVSGKAGQVAHHYFTKKAHGAVRWNFFNGVYLTNGEHFNFHSRGKIEPCRDALIKKIGQEKFDALKREAHQTRKYSLDELRQIKQDLLNRITYWKAYEDL